MRSNYINPATMERLLAKMTLQNALALRVSLETGLRIDDTLKLKTSDLKRSTGFYVREMKTGKRKYVKLPKTLKNVLRDVSGTEYVFPSRSRNDKHRVRQTVWRDLKRACRALDIDEKGISPHTLRKMYAVSLYEDTGCLLAVQKYLNHKFQSTTIAYALSDKLKA